MRALLLASFVLALQAADAPIFPYGAVYFRKSNPPEQDWARDHQTAARIGMNTFRHWFMWSAIEVAPGKTVGLGMEPGDEYWHEPYFYSNMSPSPTPETPRGELAGNGVWNTRDWIGAVLPASRVGETGQQSQVEEFVRSAVRECTRILRGG